MAQNAPSVQILTFLKSKIILLKSEIVIFPFFFEFFPIPGDTFTSPGCSIGKMALEYQEIATIYEKYGSMVLRRCTQLLGDQDMAQDAAQEVFVKFFQKRDRLNAHYPSSLLYRIATNTCLNVIRDSRRQSPCINEWLYQVASWDDPRERLEARSVLKRLFGQHEESTRTMAVLHFLDGMTLEEVAHEVGLSVSGVRKRLRRLRETLLDLKEVENREVA